MRKSRDLGFQKGNLVVTLGISAIDVLCCALVGGLVLFLILSVEGRSRSVSAGEGSNQDIVLLMSHPLQTSPNPVLRLRIFPPLPPVPPPQSGNDFAEYWTDSPDKRHESNSMFDLGGGSLWSVAAANQDPQVSVLHIRKAIAGTWGFSVGYLDSTADAPFSHPPVGVAIRVLGQGGEAECIVTLPVGEIVEMRNGSQLKFASGAPIQSCQGDLQKAMQVLGK
jgi:hypothetical protein